jgi:hypothetical protein
MDVPCFVYICIVMYITTPWAKSESYIGIGLKICCAPGHGPGCPGPGSPHGKKDPLNRSLKYNPYIQKLFVPESPVPLGHLGPYGAACRVQAGDSGLPKLATTSTPKTTIT